MEELDYKLAYIVEWPACQKYQDLVGFKSHSYKLNGGSPAYAIDKDWLEKAIEREKDKQYAGFWDV